MFEFGKPLTESVTQGDNIVHVAAAFEANGLLELKSNLDLKSLDNTERLNRSKKLSPVGATRNPRELWTVVLVSLLVMVRMHGTAEVVPHNENGLGVRHAHLNPQGEAIHAARTTKDWNADASLPVEQTGRVGYEWIHSVPPGVTDGMIANSVELRCPARKGAEGQYRTKQEGLGSLGVRNEQVQSPKGKVCSELGRNVETDTETISGCAGHEVIVPHMLTECNSKFLYSVVDPNRFFRPTDWMPTITQDGKVLRLHLRMNNVCSNRMLQGVIGQPGVTANSWS